MANNKSLAPFLVFPARPTTLLLMAIPNNLASSFDGIDNFLANKSEPAELYLAMKPLLLKDGDNPKIGKPL